ncbi:MAG: choline kinase family protein [Gammaproteobacteria bacterium]|nr:choline kinase family protein [Gammaproteobacteria bacterium]MDH5302578.1 choline kinase family protein [Gammaproteobacteria bacterium]MDH5321057.1 choline kinase family protein [Gammaproteobacteria bacterium]
MSAAVDDALAQIPGWENATYSELKGGLTNPCWLVEQGDLRAVLKVDNQARGEPFNTRRLEAQVQGRACGAGLANAVLYASDTLLMTEYVEGTIWSAGCLSDYGNLDRLAAAMKKLHALPLTGRTFDAVGAARNYAQRIVGGDAGRIRDCLAKIESMHLPHNLCCCHNDLVAANIIYTPVVRFLDWEYACDNDPFFDLATIVAHHRLSPERAAYLLDAYFEGDGYRWRTQLHRQAEFYEALLWLWEAAHAGGRHAVDGL